MLLLPLPIENNIYINSGIVVEHNFFKFAGNLYSYKWVSLNVCCLIFHNKLSDIFILPVCFACLNILEWEQWLMTFAPIFCLSKCFLLTRTYVSLLSRKIVICSNDLKMFFRKIWILFSKCDVIALLAIVRHIET